MTNFFYEIEIIKLILFYLFNIINKLNYLYSADFITILIIFAYYKTIKYLIITPTMKKFMFWEFSTLLILSIILILPIFFTLCSTDNGFEDCHQTIMLKNTQSTNSIYYFTTLKDGFWNYDPTNPDYAIDYKILPGESKKIRIGMGETTPCWEQMLKSASGYLYIYIYDANNLETTGWNTGKKNYVKKYTLDVKQLKKANWNISYP